MVAGQIEPRPVEIGSPRRILGIALGWVLAVASQAAGRARAWHVAANLPGLAGIGLVSAGIGLRFGLWAGLLSLGVFCLRIDSRL